jgi:hypothetical protein
MLGTSLTAVDDEACARELAELEEMEMAHEIAGAAVPDRKLPDAHEVKTPATAVAVTTTGTLPIGRYFRCLSLLCVCVEIERKPKREVVLTT